MKTYEKLYDYLKTQDDYVSGENWRKNLSYLAQLFGKRLKPWKTRVFKFIRLKNGVIKLSQVTYYSLNKLQPILISRSL